MEYHICAAVQADVRAIAELEKNCFSSPWTFLQIQQEISKSNGLFLVCKHGAQLVGYVSGEDIAGDFYMGNLAVTLSHRRRGLALNLLNRLIESANDKGCNFITLEVRSSNKAARKLYEKTGFVFMGERKNFYAAPVENAAIYTLFFNKTTEEI